ncbi:MAG: bifunctional adenosylcobinamide kinase/adenosylcobinamide-phosphate guanylyltransferase [Candidatus Eremiobacteraeota bacterium]|nr:bifunctional adenosylcobinamide kinase/adenosylcobinamide-phosphate guanylyltransferase [Candidatus Eremiobacteraeota bacterium]
MSLTLITGPVRSGKSTFAQHLAEQTSLAVIYVAPAGRDPEDREWEGRIARHAADRPAHWTVVETSAMKTHELCAFLAASPADQCLLVDSLGTWLACAIDRRRDNIEHTFLQANLDLESEALELAGALLACKAQVIAVGEQVGWDLVPGSAVGRLFRDVLGRLQQRLALSGERAYLVVSGHAIDLHAAGAPVSAT